jgi:methionine-rich copper-binding protein CopC
MRAAVLLAVLAGLAVSAPGATAAPVFTSPLGISTTSTTNPQPAIGFSDGGDAVALWARQNGAGEAIVIEAANRPSGGAWTLPAPLGTTTTGSVPNVQIAVNGRGDAAAVWTEKRSDQSVIRTSSRPAGGSWDPARDLSAVANSVISNHVAINSAGAAIASWAAGPDSTHLTTQAAVRPAGQDWDQAKDVSGAGLNAYLGKAMIDDVGNATVVFRVVVDDTHQYFQSADRPANGSWQDPVTISGTAGGNNGVNVAVAPNGSTAAIWNQSDGSNPIVRVAFRAAGGQWQPAVPLSLSGKDAEGGRVAFDDAGNATAVWQRESDTGTTYRAQAATRSPGGSWSQPATLSDAAQNVGSPDVAATGLGNFTAVWEARNGTGRSVLQAARGSGASWTRFDDLTTTDRSATAARIVANSSGDGVVIWQSYVSVTDFVVTYSGLDGAGPRLAGLSAPGSGSVGQPLSFSVSPADTWSSVSSTTWNFGDGTGAGGNAVDHAYGAPGSYTVSVTSTDSVGNSSTDSRVVNVTASGVPGPVAPTVSDAKQTNKTWRMGSKLPTTARKKAPLGTTFKFKLSAPAQVTLDFTQQVSGRKVKRKCVKPTRRNRRSPKCKRTRSAGVLSVNGKQGANSVAFQGRLTKRKKLKPGKYTLVITATSSDGLASKPVKLKFKIVP